MTPQDNQLLHAPYLLTKMKSQNYLRIFFIIGSLLLLTANFAASADEVSLKVGILKNFPPQYQLDSNGKPTGFAIDSFEALNLQVGYKLEYRAYDSWADIQQALRAREIDLIPNMGFADFRKEWADFSSPVETFPVSLFTRVGTKNIQALSDLDFRPVGVVRLNVGEKIVAKNENLQVEIFKDVFDAVMSLLSGTIDAIIYPEPTLERIIQAAGLEDKIKTIHPPLLEIKRGIGTYKGNKVLLNQFNPLIPTFIQSPQYQKIYTKWYGKKAPYWTTSRLLILFLGNILTVVFVMIIWRNISIGKLNKKLTQTKESLEDQVIKRTKSLAEKELKYRTLINNLPAGIIVHAADSSIMLSNPMASTLLGLSEAQLKGKAAIDPTWNFLFPDGTNMEPDDYPVIKVLNSNKPVYNYRLGISRPDLVEPLWVLCNAYPFFNAEKKLETVVVTVADITSLRNAEQKIKKEQNKLITILNSIDAHVYVSDMETYEILFMNKNMIQDFGQDFTGDICWKVFRKESGPCDICTNHLLIDDLGHPTGSHTWNSHNPVNGNHYINHDRAIEWADGRLVHLQIATDISNVKVMEQQLHQKKKMEAVGYMAGGMAHNFNNNLSIILGNLEISKLKLPDHPEIGHYLDQAKIAVLRSRDLVKQIITYSRKGIQDKAAIQLKPVIEETVNLLSVTLPVSVQIKTTYAPTAAPVFIHADASQMQEVIINLCNNAIHAMEEQGEVNIALETVELKQKEIPFQYNVPPGHFVKMSVQDSGQGMADETLEQIFDPFFTTKEEYEGAGMGLATVQGIVAQHHGLIKVDSTLGQGTTFELYFPVVATTAETPSTMDKSLPKGVERILFVDDNDALAELGEQLLTELGYQVTIMTDSQEALKLFAANADSFQLLITDQTMPRLSGKDLIAEIKAIRPDLPTILSTGFSNQIDEDQASDLGISAFLLKPLVLPELAQAVRRVLDQKSGC